MGFVRLVRLVRQDLARRGEDLRLGGQELLLEDAGVGDRAVGVGDAADGGVEIREGGVGQAGGDLGAEAQGEWRFVDDERAPSSSPRRARSHLRRLR